MAALMGVIGITTVHARDSQLVREVLVPNQDDRPESPDVLIRLSDGGFVAAGPGFALKIDAGGQLVWRFRSGTGTEFFSFRGGAEGRNGEVLLCASPQGRGDRLPYMPSNLVRLDAQGRLIEARTLAPTEAPARGILQVQGCRRWGGDLLVYGTSSVVLREAAQGRMPLVEIRYWCARLDLNGTTRWDRKFEFTPDKSGAVGTIDSVLLSDDDHAYIAARLGTETYLFGFRGNGEMLQSHALAGRYTLVEGVRPGNDVELVGGTKEAWQALKLDSQLQEVQVTSMSDAHLFNSRRAFRLPDSSLVAFGEFFQSGGGYGTGYLWFDPRWKLREQHRLVRPPLVETGTLPAVSDTADDRQFMTAHLLMKAKGGSAPRDALQRIGVNFSLFGFP